MMMKIGMRQIRESVILFGRFMSITFLYMKVKPPSYVEKGE